MFTEDLSLFFDVETGFAVLATFSLVGGGTRAVKVTFNTPTESVELYNTEVEADAMFLLARTSDLANVRRGQTAIIGGVTYNVERVTHDGTGISTVHLGK